ncbi:hotdog domain-containing protein [Gordonia sp. (in: high G+C Gram-positive bacteria)]|uniref:hotdog domain-containing protein n=1 Tax=Gordonia sp. (in: high G+C Gram-positive bacteria) TaxID=84139 RepID=UPI0035AFAB9B
MSAKAIHRRYVAFSDAHYAGNLVDGAYALKLFGDVGTNLSIELDGHEGLFAGYSSVEFLAPVRGGDVVEAEASLVRKGNRSRTVDFELRVLCRGTDDAGHAQMLRPPLIAVRARGTAVIPAGTEKSSWN